MDKIIEDAEYLTIGKKKYDVSNVPYGKKKIARFEWDNMVKEMDAEGAVDGQRIEDFLDFYGLYLIRQPFVVLKRRMTLVKAIFTYISRMFLTVKHIQTYDEDQYNLFSDWAHLQITGRKKKDLKKIDQIQKLELKMLEEMDKLNLSPGQLEELLQTFLRETAGHMNISAPSQSK